MAIMIEQEEGRTNWSLIIGSGVFVIILFAALYYFFFKSPATIEGIVVSNSQQQLLNIANTKFDYKPVLDQLGGFSNNFSDPIPPTSLGRANPFQPM